jgi:hypothetical protein
MGLISLLAPPNTCNSPIVLAKPDQSIYRASYYFYAGERPANHARKLRMEENVE